MIPNPILKVLSTFNKNKVECLLIGGQACIIYGAAEFSRDSDFVVLCAQANLQKLQAALDSLHAKPIYVPALEIKYLAKGHACHFRCGAADVKGLRIDVLSKLRGCESFEKLWKRRRTVKPKEGGTIEVIGLEDLVQAKKTQRDKDWLMLRRLVENDIVLHQYKRPAPARVQWWFLECRTPDILIRLARRYPARAKNCSRKRRLLTCAIRPDAKKLDAQIHKEERREREQDIEYWSPLKKELETLRHKHLRDKKWRN